MRETPLSLSQRQFIVKAAKDNKRIDCREPNDVRIVRIAFGKERGSCQVLLGNTRTFAQVTCEVGVPKPSRPSEGSLHVNVELSPMAAPHHEPGRPSLYAVELTRLLERCLSESRCIDLESLCIISGEQVWIVRVDVHVLDDDGGLIDCASIAAITALSHFRRPVFTVVNEKLVVFPPEEREPVPLSVYHMPICTTFAFFDKGSSMLLDPNSLEQRASDGKMVVGMTAHRKICTLHVNGNILLQKEKILKCVSVASKKAAEITHHIKKALEDDASARSSGEVVSFGSIHYHDSILSFKKPEVAVAVNDNASNGSPRRSNEETNTTETVIKKGPGTAVVGGGGPCTWDVSDDSSEMEIDVVSRPKVKPEPAATKSHDKIETIDISEDSEEEEVVILNPGNSTNEESTTTKDEKARTWYQNHW